MINKQKLWFLTLFSIILVLTVYYVALPNETLSNLLKSSETNSEESKVSINSEDSLASLRIENDEETLSEISKLEETLQDKSVSAEDKSNAYNKLLLINLNKGKEAALEELVLKEHKIKSFIKIKNDQINVTVAAKDSSPEKANQIMRTIQKKFSEKKYITVKYQ